jgi:hypothetical protein
VAESEVLALTRRLVWHKLVLPILLAACVSRVVAAKSRVLDLSMRPKAGRFDPDPRRPTPDEELTRILKPKMEVVEQTGGLGKFPIILAAVPTIFWHQLIIHEGIHGLAATALGRKVYGFHPYPHKHDGHFYFGRLSADTEDFKPGEQILFSLSPAIFDLTTFAGCDAMMSAGIVKANSVGGTAMFMLGMAAPMIDFMVGLFRGSDWEHARRAAGSKAWMLNVTGGIAAGIMLWRIMVHAKTVFKRSL